MRILALILIFTLSSCVVSQKTFDEEVKKNAVLKQRVDELESEFRLKDQVMRGVITGILERISGQKDDEVIDEHND
tara:strand:+ start:120 stop:347 length:228 start_codon:yes stop_codon:yes gene_type:complete